MTKKELKARCKELGIPTEDLTTNALLEDAIAKREAQLEAEKAAQASKENVEGSEDADTETQEVVTDVPKNDTEVPKNDTEVPKNVTPKGTTVTEEEAAQEQEKPRLVHEDKRGRKWGFKDSAPKTLNIDGHPMSQEEIFDNDDVISELVYGNSSFLIQIHE